MTLGAHLLELRKRTVIAAVGVVLGRIAAFVLSDPIISLLVQPITDIAKSRGNTLLNFDTISGGFDMRIRISFVLGILLSAPVWLSEVWMFTMPGLTRKEVRYTVGFVGAAIPLFFAGCAVGWLTVPHIVQIMSSFVPEQAAQYFQYGYYMDFVLKLLLVMGVAFVLPVFLVLLNFLGVMSGRGIISAWRWAILAISVFAAMATPAADVTSMLLLGSIMVVLYFAAAGVAMLFDRRRDRKQESLVSR